MASSQNRYSAHILVKTVFGPRVSQQQSYGEVVYVLGISSQSHDLQTHTYIVRLRPGPCADLVKLLVPRIRSASKFHHGKARGHKFAEMVTTQNDICGGRTEAKLLCIYIYIYINHPCKWPQTAGLRSNAQEHYDFCQRIALHGPERLEVLCMGSARYALKEEWPHALKQRCWQLSLEGSAALLCSICV